MPRWEPRPPQGRGTHCFPEVGLPDGYEPPSAALHAPPPVPPERVTVTLKDKAGNVVAQTWLEPGMGTCNYELVRPGKVKRIEVRR